MSYLSSPFSKVHVDIHNTGASYFSGVSDSKISMQVIDSHEVGHTISIITDADDCLWGTGRYSWHLSCPDEQNKFHVIDSIPKPAQLRSQDTFLGIYSFMMEDNTYYGYAASNVVRLRSVLGVNDKPESIEMIARWVAPEQAGLVMTIASLKDGNVMVLTSKSFLFFLNTAMTEVLATYKVNGEVFNSTAQAGDTLVLVTTDLLVTLDLSNIMEVTVKWANKYRDPDTGTGSVIRPSKEGSGTTPTIMTIPETDNKYIVITDGGTPENVLIYDLEKGNLAGKVNPEPMSPGEDFFTEQSPIVHGNKILVMQNAPTAFGNRVIDLLQEWKIEQRVQDVDTARIRENALLFPVLFGDASHGYYQYEFDENEEDPAKSLSLSWSTDLSCPNSIPALSVAENRLYCVGRKCLASEEDCVPSSFGGYWSIDSLNWSTGELMRSIKIGKSPEYNSMYAPMQILGDGLIGYGSLKGLVLVEKI